MGLTVKPLDCHGGCLGCYEKNIRDRGQFPPFEIEKVLATLTDQMALDKNNSWNCPTLHGGEPLLLPMNEIEVILKTVFEKYGRSGIQTSGAGITPEHIELFKKYKTMVGVSVDGDTPETNAGRWNAPGFDVAEMTAKTMDALAALKEADVSASAIIVLRQCNAGTPALINSLVDFALKMKSDYNICSIRFNAVIASDERTERLEQLSNEQLTSVYKKLIIKTIVDDTLLWYPAKDFVNLLNGKSAECIFGECDPWATEAEIPIIGDGSLGVCMKREGVILRTEKSLARYESLRQVSQDYGGCKGCYWWRYCKGGCPGAGIDGDWRNRSRFCETYKEIFNFASSFPLYNFEDNQQVGCNGHGDAHGDREHGDSNDPAWRKAHPEWKGGK